MYLCERTFIIGTINNQLTIIQDCDLNVLFLVHLNDTLLTSKLNLEGDFKPWRLFFLQYDCKIVLQYYLDYLFMHI